MSFNKPRRAMLDDDVLGAPINLVAGSTIDGNGFAIAPTPTAGGALSVGRQYIATENGLYTLPNPLLHAAGSIVTLSKMVAATAVVVNSVGGETIEFYDTNGVLKGSDTSLTINLNLSVEFKVNANKWEARAL